MKHWTTQAEKRLEEYLQERVAREGLEGEDAAELKDDLRRHIHEETEKADSPAFGLMQLENIIGRMDSGFTAAPPTSSTPPKKKGIISRISVWAFGVVMPLLVLVFEVISSFCGSVFFDPVPTWWHVACVAAVPVVNLALLRGWFGTRRLAEGVSAGFALMITLFYALLFLPLFHLSVLALLYLGLGLVSLTPVFAAIATWRIGVATRKKSIDVAGYQRGWRTGMLVGLLVLSILELPGLWTRVNLQMAMGEGRENAIARLRVAHSERVLLKACYEGNRGTQMSTDIAGWLAGRCLMPLTFAFDETPPGDSEQARDVFFRVTGSPFNSRKPPESARGGSLLGRGDPLADFEFDDHLGGDDVAVRLKGLDLSQSRLDGHVDTTSGLGYGEWTMVFRNRTGEAKEARCQVRLPRGGRVSRLTLWVEGEPREAAFNTISKVKAAYRAIAVVQRRDPVLVNVCGPDTVMVQCFPVPARGEMKIRLGITAPLADGHWEIPYILERNFGLEDRLEHAVWMQANESFSMLEPSETTPSTQDGPGHSLSVALEGGKVLENGRMISQSGYRHADQVWCEDRFAKPEEKILIRELRTSEESAPSGKPIVVIDGSALMKSVRPWLLEAVADVPDLEIILADDSARPVTLDQLGDYRFSGGRDNQPALLEAVRRAKSGGRPVIWIHGPQVVSLSQTEALLQLMERGSHKLRIIDVEAVPGPNRMSEALAKSGYLTRGPALMDARKDLTRLLANPTMQDIRGSWQWRRAASSEGLTGSKVWDHLARDWAAATAENTSRTMSDVQRAELAARYQLVTLHSGAVVLETRQQFEKHGLTPVDGDTVPNIPNIPEASTSLLIMITGILAALRRKRIHAD